MELVFFPSFCRLCGRLLEKNGERVVCGACWAEVRPHRSPICQICGKFFEGEGESHLCGKCVDDRAPFSIHRSSAKYEGALKDLILLFKYKKIAVLGRGLGEFAFQALGQDKDLWAGLDAVIPVPLHPRRKRERGFNQARILAKSLASLAGVGLWDKALVKIRNIPPQTSLEAGERRKNVRGAYLVKEKEKIQGKVLLLVDDVYTTGATLKECSRTLLEAGAKEARALTIAQA